MTTQPVDPDTVEPEVVPSSDPDGSPTPVMPGEDPGATPPPEEKPVGP